MASGGLPHGSVPPSGGGGRSGGGFSKIEGIHVAAAAVAVGATVGYCMNKAFGRTDEKFELLVQVLERWEKKTPDFAHGGLDI